MQRNWRDMNVNLSKLVQKIIQFFELNEFSNVTALQTEKGYQVIAGDSKRYKMESDVSVTIEGKPDDFTINLTSLKVEKKSSLPLILTQMFGGGYFLLKNFRSEETLQKLDRDFTLKISSIVEQAREPS